MKKGLRPVLPARSIASTRIRPRSATTFPRRLDFLDRRAIQGLVVARPGGNTRRAPHIEIQVELESFGGELALSATHDLPSLRPLGADVREGQVRFAESSTL